jgi:hypothetical protein
MISIIFVIWMAYPSDIHLFAKEASLPRRRTEGGF